jgi:hypothetical protein
MHFAICAERFEKLDLNNQFFTLGYPPFNLPFHSPPDRGDIASFLMELEQAQRLDVVAFLNDLDQAAARTAARSKDQTVTHAERRRDYQKLSSAQCAHDLLVDNGKGPTLTLGGAFLELASVLYEAATGKVGVDLRSHCRSVSAELKQK